MPSTSDNSCSRLTQIFLVKIYVIFAVIMEGAVLLVTPPGQVPDERSHFARAVQISMGSMVGTRLNADDAGDYLPAHFPTQAELLGELKFRPEKKVSLDRLRALSTLRWESTKMAVGFPNTVIYAPLSYIPGALASYVGRHSGASVFQTFYLVRIANAVVMISLCALGIAMAQRGALFLTVIATLPMVSALGASCSQDGVLIGIVICTVGLLTCANSVHAMSLRFWGLISFLFLILSLSKPPYLICTGVAFGFRLQSRRHFTILPFAASVVGFAFWYVLGVLPAKIPFHRAGHADVSQQTAWLFSHLNLLPLVVLENVKAQAMFVPREFIGVLGWLDTTMPTRFYFVALAALFSAFLLPFATVQRSRHPWPTLRAVVVTSLCLVLVYGAINGLFFLVWTQVGSLRVEGIQGRYFLPLAPFIALILPRSESCDVVGKQPLLTHVAIATLVAYLLYDFEVTTRVLIHRYWI